MSIRAFPSSSPKRSLEFNSLTEDEDLCHLPLCQLPYWLLYSQYSLVQVSEQLRSRHTCQIFPKPCFSSFMTPFDKFGAVLLTALNKAKEKAEDYSEVSID